MNQRDFSYSVFGLSVRSNLPIPGLSPAEIDPLKTTTIHPIVGVRLGAAPNLSRMIQNESDEPFYTSPYRAPSGEPALRIWQVGEGEILRLSYFDGMQFWVDREGANIWASWPDQLSVEDAATYLLGPVLGLLLRLRGATCLHASAVAVGGKAVAFVGSTGAGKSTTAAALARHGLPVLSDDIVALSEASGRFEVLPSYPYLSLWPEPVSILYGSEDAAPRFVPGWEKRCISAESQGVKFERRAVPLGAIYVLAPRQEEPSPSIAAISPENAFLSLVANTYATNILNREMRAQEFHVLGRLIKRVPVRQLVATRDLQRLDELCHVICQDVTPQDTSATPKV